MPPALPHMVNSWPMLLVSAWLCALVILASLTLAIVRIVINKTNASDVPQALRALGPLLGTAVGNIVRGSLPLPLLPPTSPQSGAERGQLAPPEEQP